MTLALQEPPRQISGQQVLARAESDGAPFVHSAECRDWVEQGLRELSEDGNRGSAMFT